MIETTMVLLAGIALCKAIILFYHGNNIKYLNDIISTHTNICKDHLECIRLQRKRIENIEMNIEYLKGLIPKTLDDDHVKDPD